MRQESGFSVYCGKAYLRLTTWTTQWSDISPVQEVHLQSIYCGGIEQASSHDDCCTAAKRHPSWYLNTLVAYFSSKKTLCVSPIDVSYITPT